MHALETTIGYVFSNKELLEEALSHPSGGKSRDKSAFNNQRLEFLGDAVLGLVIARLLFEMYPSENEGDLARRQAALIRGETLTEIAKSIHVGDFLRLSASEEAAGGRSNATNIEDACEALIGAMYLDGGLEEAEKFILAHWTERARSTATPPKDAKTALQEWAQARGLPLPGYQVVVSEGPAHAPIFTIEVSVQGFAPAAASGASKRVAEQLAAGQLLNRLQRETP